MHKAFISYHHSNDQLYKDKLVEIGEGNSIFVDRSVDTGDIPDGWPDQQIRRTIRDEYLKDSTVTIVLVGRETRRRKHVDWEIHSSMYDGPVNKRSGMVVINLPGISDQTGTVAYGDEEKRLLYPDNSGWVTIDEWAECKSFYPHMPDRIIDNLIRSDVKISVAPWNRITVEGLSFLIEAAFRNRLKCKYDFSSPMRKANS